MRLKRFFNNPSPSLLPNFYKKPYYIKNISNDYHKYNNNNEKFLYGSINADVMDANERVILRLRLYSDCEIEWLRYDR